MNLLSRVPSRSTMLSLAALAWALGPESARSQPAPILPEATIEATIVNNRREEITAKVWVDGLLMTLGDLPAGERRTFTLPPEVTTGARYYLLGDSRSGVRVRSEALTASTERHAHFVMGRSLQRSYVRYTKVE
jgi:hypothetical protein